MAYIDPFEVKEDKSEAASFMLQYRLFDCFVHGLTRDLKNKRIEDVVKILAGLYWGPVDGDLSAYFDSVREKLNELIDSPYGDLKYRWMTSREERAILIHVHEAEAGLRDSLVADIRIPWTHNIAPEHLQLEYASVSVVRPLRDVKAEWAAEEMRRHNGGR